MKTILALTMSALAGGLLGSVERDAYWMRTPATDWKGALLLGNGRVGAIVYGRPNQETVVLNETGVWAPKRDWPLNPKGAEVIPKIRALLFAGKQAEAERMTANALLRGGDKVAPYQPAAFLRLAFAPEETPFADYRRSLSLDEGVGAVTYTQGGVTFTREAWVEADGECLTMTFAASKPVLAFTLGADRPGGLAVAPEGKNRLRLKGGTGKDGVRFEAVADVATDGAIVVSPEGRLSVKDATRATVRVAVRSDLLGPLADPAADLARPADRAAHAKAFAALYNRMRLDLPHTATGEALEDRIARVAKAGALDTETLLLLHDYCRYLLIASSRPGGLPANLQGIWNEQMNPPWNSDWHLDINLSMHYWPAGPWGLADRAEPLVSLAERLMPKSEPVARDMLGAEGWFLTTATDPWGYCVPFRHPCWGMYVSGGAWLLQDGMKAWRFSRDPALLRRLLPLLREQCRFYLSWLVPRPGDGVLVSGPAVSPENTYAGQDGGNAAVDMGTAHDRMLIAETFRDYLLAARECGARQDGTVARVAAALPRLAKPQIGPDGALLEWSKPFGEAEPGHRHISHAYGLIPGHSITHTGTPALAAAIRKSLEKRLAHNYHTFGWSIGLAAGIWARVDEGDKAFAMIDKTSRFFCTNLVTLTVGVPQVNDTMGVPAAMLDCIARTEHGVLRILPALPARLPEGKARGLRAENGLALDIDWEDGRLAALTLTSARGGPAKVEIDGRVRTVTLEKDVPLRLR